MNDAEGVIKFRLDYEPVSHLTLAASHWQALQHCRDTAFSLGVVGQDETRYEGYGFGNVSVRCRADEQAMFAISGTQTGALPQLAPEHYAYVTAYDVARNQLSARGVCKPSSEAMTHAALYDVLPGANAVIHGHHAGLWQNARALGLCCTAADVPYGTPAMARAMQARVQANEVPGNTIVMLGHLDGFITWGEDADTVVAQVRAVLSRLS